MQELNKYLKVLFLEDNLFDAELVQKNLKKAGYNFEFSIVDSKKDFENELIKFKPDLIFSDYSLPEFNGLVALGIAKEKYPEVPYIFISGNIGEERAIETLRNGATDYVLKDKLSKLVPAVERALKEVEERFKRIKVVEELIESEKRYRTIYDLSPVGIITLNNEGYFVSANKAFEKIVGYYELELKKMHILDITYTEDRELTMNRISKIKQKITDSDEFEKRYIHKNGNLVWVRIHQQYKYDKKLDQFNYVAIVEDISLQKEYTNELKTAKEDAEEANRLKSSFLYMMSHEIRTPLTTIMGITEYIKETTNEYLTAEDKRLFDMIELSSERLLKTMMNILDYSSLEVGEFKIEMRRINLNQIINLVYEKYHEAARKKDLRINVTDLNDSLTVLADEYCLVNVIESLLDNAVKYSEKGTISIQIKKIRDFVDIIIKDEGIGISEKYLKHLFHSFSQEDTRLSRRFEGLGLGLALSKKYIDKMNGCIKIESKHGEGTTVTLSLPLSY